MSLRPALAALPALALLAAPAAFAAQPAAPLSQRCAAPAPAGKPAAAEPTVVDRRARAAAQHGLDFLSRAAVEWQSKNRCNGCHVQAVTLEALSVGIHNQYKVARPELATVLDGLLNQSGGGRQPGGLSYQKTQFLGSAKAFGGAAFARYDQWVDGDLRHDLMQVAEELLTFQDKDGGVRSDYPNNLPVSVGPGQRTFQAAQTWRQAYARTADERWLPPIQRAESYLHKAARDLQQRPDANLQEINYALLGLAAAGVGAQEDVMRALQQALLARQQHDGGWGYQRSDAQSNAFATGQSVYTLRMLGLSDRDAAVERGTAWLIDHQQKDGGWGGSGFAKAEAMWGVLGLVSVDVLSLSVAGLSDGQHVDGVVKLLAQARDNQGGQKKASVEQVELMIDDLPVQRACGDSVSYAWDTAKLEPGKHLVDLWARNSRGQVSRRRIEVFAGPVYLTQLGTSSGAREVIVSLRNIAAPSAQGTVELQILPQGQKGAPLFTAREPGAQGAMRLHWDGRDTTTGKDAPTGKYLARVRFLRGGAVVQSEDLLFVRDTPEQQRASYGQIQGQLRMPKSMAAGAPAPAAAANARVDLVDDAGNVVQSVRSTNEGQYRFKNVDAGRYKVRVRKEGFAPAEREVKADKAAESSASLDL